ncbi:hypothetical protein BUALT_Bualt08G0009600 [Buddleja alternifolia]|uniref:GAG-pre-integrase domain-containing protein n=1 Tax=Buddleja alternifolia TaxID=168488 RepID=A0AAV6X4E9_9LAMI|nr:hypothetical protein BUALT_Bualt08G0009600 [Buddleja alternifolia]
MLDQLGYAIKMEAGAFKILKGFLVQMKGVRKNGIYSLLGSTIIGSAGSITDKQLSQSMLRHRRLRHMSDRGLIELSKQDLLTRDKIKDLEFCETCIYGKSSRVKFGTTQQRTKEKQNSQKIQLEVELTDEYEEEEHESRRSDLNEDRDDQVDLNTYSLIRDRQRRPMKAPTRYGYADVMAFAFAIAEELGSAEPSTYVDVMVSKQRRH